MGSKCYCAASGPRKEHPVAREGLAANGKPPADIHCLLTTRGPCRRPQRQRPLSTQPCSTLFAPWLPPAAALPAHSLPLPIRSAIQGAATGYKRCTRACTRLLLYHTLCRTSDRLHQMKEEWISFRWGRSGNILPAGKAARQAGGATLREWCRCCPHRQCRARSVSKLNPRFSS